MSQLNYEKDCNIDESSLDVEWLEQTTIAMKYGKYWAFCKKNVAQIEEELKLIKSELIKEANENPVQCCKKEKPTAVDIEAYYRDHKRHKEAKQKFIEAQYELDIAEIAKNEISFTRKATLEALVTLFGQQYFAGPSMPRDISTERAKAQAFKKKQEEEKQKLFERQSSALTRNK